MRTSVIRKGRFGQEGAKGDGTRIVYNGVRGLWAGRMHLGKGRLSGVATSDDASSMAGSRPGSADSEAHSQRGDALRTAALRDDSPVPQPQQQQQEQQRREEQQLPATGWAASGTKSPLTDDFSLPFAGAETKFTLRTKGLRENVSG